jgi:hypothetical protein
MEDHPVERLEPASLPEVRFMETATTEQTNTADLSRVGSSGQTDVSGSAAPTAPTPTGMTLLDRHHTQLSAGAAGVVEAQRLGAATVR